MLSGIIMCHGWSQNRRAGDDNDHDSDGEGQVADRSINHRPCCCYLISKQANTVELEQASVVVSRDSRILPRLD